MGVLDPPPFLASAGQALSDRVDSLSGGAGILSRTTDGAKQMAFPSTMSTAPTITQSATATITGQTFAPNAAVFRRTGAPPYAFGGNLAVRMQARDTLRTDNTDRAWSGPWRIEFDFDGQAFEINCTANSGVRFRVWVDNQPSAATPQSLPSTTSAPAFVKVDFGSRAYRRVTLEMTNYFELRGINVAATDSVWSPTQQSPRFMWVGDSYGDGVQATDRTQAMPITIGRLLGFLDIWTQSAVASTGFIATAGSPAAVAYPARIDADVVPYSPDVVVLAGTINDRPYVGTNAIGPAVTSSINKLKAITPRPQIVVTSPLYVGTPDAATLTVRDEVKAAADAAKVPFIDALSPVWFRGAGRVGAPQGDGNADLYRSSDGTHPNQAGYDVFARLLAGQIGRKLGLRL